MDNDTTLLLDLDGLAGARITTRLRTWAGRRIRDAGSTVVRAARDLHLSWPTVMHAFRDQACEVVDAPPPVNAPSSPDPRLSGLIPPGRGARRSPCSVPLNSLSLPVAAG
ncbi:transposase family protein [Streptomyces sp. TE5632]